MKRVLPYTNAMEINLLFFSEIKVTFRKKRYASHLKE